MSDRRNKLNSKQLQLLKLIFKFRFVTAELVAQHKGISRTSVNYSLAILMDQELLGRSYDSRRRVMGQPAVYYLTPKALRLLRDAVAPNERVIHVMYKNKSVSEAYMNSKLIAMRAYLALRSTYLDVFNVFTPTESAGFEYLPEPKPDLYLSRKHTSEALPNDYLLDILTDTQMFIVKKRIKAYLEHCESGDWGEGEYPYILLVCPDAKTEVRILRYAETLLEDLEIYTTTVKALLGSGANISQIWSNASEPETLLSLEEGIAAARS